MAAESTESGEGSQPPTEHGRKRKAQAEAGDVQREVGDPNRVVREGKQFLDTGTGYHVFVLGNRVVITDRAGRRVTQFKNALANTRTRVENGRWKPLEE